MTPTYPGPEWPVWLVQDQRFVDHRPDVLSWQTEPLAEDLRVAGDLKAELFASTSGTDSDWIVKLIDVYPEIRLPDPATARCMGGYQLMIAGRDSARPFSQQLRTPGTHSRRQGRSIHYRSAYE